MEGIGSSLPIQFQQIQGNFPQASMVQSNLTQLMQDKTNLSSGAYRDVYPNFRLHERVYQNNSSGDCHAVYGMFSPGSGNGAGTIGSPSYGGNNGFPSLPGFSGIPSFNDIIGTPSNGGDCHAVYGMFSPGSGNGAGTINYPSYGGDNGWTNLPGFSGGASFDSIIGSVPYSNGGEYSAVYGMFSPGLSTPTQGGNYSMMYGIMSGSCSSSAQQVNSFNFGLPASAGSWNKPTNGVSFK